MENTNLFFSQSFGIVQPKPKSIEKISFLEENKENSGKKSNKLSSLDISNQKSQTLEDQEEQRRQDAINAYYLNKTLEKEFCIDTAVQFLKQNIEFFIAPSQDKEKFDRWLNFNQEIKAVIKQIDERIYKSFGTGAEAAKYLQALYFAKDSLVNNKDTAIKSIFIKNQYLLDHIICYSNLLAPYINRWYQEYNVKRKFNCTVSQAQLAIAANLSTEHHALNLSSMAITKKNLPYLIYLLANKLHLTELIISGCQIQDSQIKDLGMALAQNKTILKVNLSKNLLTNEGVCELIRTQQEGLFARQFSLENNSVFPKKLKDIVSACAKKSVEGVAFYVTLFKDKKTQAKFQERWDNKYHALLEKTNVMPIQSGDHQSEKNRQCTFN